ncbi:MAG: DNA-binding PadR family transcriptional regulator [Myxococcota bacterium]|jgi:DNA-binding PadR family transcriptional regulator
MVDPEKFLPLRAAHFHILLTLVDGPTHGYGVRRAVDERTDGRILLAAGTLYDTLQRLSRDGLIDLVDTPAEVGDEASSRWRFFALAPLGKRVLAAEVSRLEADVTAARTKLVAER